MRRNKTANRKAPSQSGGAADGQSSVAASKFHFRDLFSKNNRGLLLDIVVFIANILVMRFITRLVIDLFNEVSAENRLAKLAVGLIFLSMWVLPVTGAVLKRWHFHHRLTAQGRTVAGEETGLAGCLFNPIFYFCLNLVITSAVLSSLGDFFFGRRLLETAALFVPLVFAGLILTVFQTYFLYRYFEAPKAPPQSTFLRSAKSEVLGDVCLFLNMMLFQVFWNLLTFAPLGQPSSLVEFGGRLFFLCFIALLVYFPPRMFYLAEDINRRRTWLTMVLANSPVILRVLIGANSNALIGW